ncbi:MAG: AarF/UbiB family protein, partial [Eubacteriales bacterium]|nr:AarF/UbiB family protein [Eubacteriales bacterium]
EESIPEAEPAGESAGTPAEIQEESPAVETSPAVEIVETAEPGKKDWMEELKEELENITETLKKGAMIEAAEEEAQEQEQAVPVRSKDDMQRELADMKAEFTHTPMEMTPELEKLLVHDIKEKGKKEKKRGTEMLSVLAKHNFYANGITPKELRTTLEDLGPTYVKIGQIMSSRVDILPESYCKELEKLRQNVKELDPAVARAMIEAETGKKIEEIFSEFRDEPIGSASIGQVHYGVLHDGTKVVTKVQRPLIAEMMEKDFELLKKLAPLVGGVAPAEDGEDAMDLVTIVNEFEKVTKEELDFRIEAANTKFFKDVVLEDGQVTCPTVIDELTTERIFTMTYVDGCSIAKKEKLPEQGLDPVQAGRDILESYLHQVFDVGIFHADPHQGNIMASDGKVYWIDFGMIGQITEADMNALQDLVLGLLSGDVEGMTNGVLAIGTSSAHTDRNKLREDLEYLSNKYMNVTSLNEIDFSAVLGEVCDLADKHHIVMPGRYTMLVRSFLTIEGVMEQLCPELNLFELISDKLMERVKKSFSLEKEIMSLGRGVLDTGKKVSKIPQIVADALTDIMKGRLKVNLELTGYEDLVTSLNEKINDLILVIVGCVLFSGGCRLCQADIRPVTPNGMPVVAVIILILGISLILFAIKRIFKKK